MELSYKWRNIANQETLHETHEPNLTGNQLPEEIVDLHISISADIIFMQSSAAFHAYAQQALQVRYTLSIS